MAIFTNRIETGRELQQLFAEYNRDNYSMTTYEGIVQFYDDCYGDNPQEFDVIAWCCDLNEMEYTEVVDSYTDLQNMIDEYREEHETCKHSWYDYSAINDEEELNIVREYISEQTCIIAYDDEIISYLAF